MIGDLFLPGHCHGHGDDRRPGVFGAVEQHQRRYAPAPAVSGHVDRAAVEQRLCRRGIMTQERVAEGILIFAGRHAGGERCEDDTDNDQERSTHECPA